MKAKILGPLLLLVLTLVTPAWATVNPRSPTPTETRPPPAQSVRPAERPSRGSQAESKRYASREAASKDAKKFRAGEPVLVITATAAIIILLGVIIILLVT